MTSLIQPVPATCTFMNPVVATLLRTETDTLEIRDVAPTSGVGEGCYDGSGVANIWQVITETGPRLYTVDPKVAERLRLFIGTVSAHHRPGAPLTNLRVSGLPFCDAAGHASFLVLRLVEEDYLGITGLLSDTISALVAAKPNNLIDAMLVVAHVMATGSRCHCEFSREEQTLSFENQGLLYVFSPMRGLVEHLEMSVIQGSGDDEETLRTEKFFDLNSVEYDLLQNLERD